MNKYLNYRGTRKEKEKKPEKVFEKIIVENSPNMGKEIVTQVQEAESHTGETKGGTCQDTH